ncbi:MAG: hypothetical protein GY892_18280 [Shimia sp.]|nr:hypothetical protein [Shimia sp.]
MNLDFQTGIAADTLLFGSVRWVGWEGFNLTTTDGEWVRFEDDTLTYALGLGRQVNNKLSLAVNLGHEKSLSAVTNTALTPSSGYTSLGIAATYQITEKVSLSGGVSYYWLGNVFYDAGSGNGVTFADNHAIGAGLRLGMHF